MGAKLKVRQPLSQVEVVLADTAHQAWLEEHASLICDELNVKRVEFTENAEQYITYTVLPDLKRLGPRLGKRLPALRKVWPQPTAAGCSPSCKPRERSRCRCPTIRSCSIPKICRFACRPRRAGRPPRGTTCVVVLSTELTEDLIREGLARELVRIIQDRRKEMGCEFTDRIDVGLVTGSAKLRAAIEQFESYIRGETLMQNLSAAAMPGVEPLETTIGNDPLAMFVKRKPETSPLPPGEG